MDAVTRSTLFNIYAPIRDAYGMWNDDKADGPAQTAHARTVETWCLASYL